MSPLADLERTCCARASRRSLLLGTGGLLAGSLIASNAEAEVTTPKGLVLSPHEGEHLIQRGGNVFIKTAPTNGSANLALGTQQVLAGNGIPVHRHFEMDEAFYVIGGSRTFILNDVPHPIGEGTTIFIPKNVWHGFQNPDRELNLLWIVSPPGLESLFRELATRPGVPPVSRSKDQINAIARRYGTEFR